MNIDIKKIGYMCLSVIFLFVISLFLTHSKGNVHEESDVLIFDQQPKVYTFDPKNATYNLDGQSVTLINGVSEISSAPGSATKTTTRYFGNEAYGDVDGDDDNDGNTRKNHLKDLYETFHRTIL